MPAPVQTSRSLQGGATTLNTYYVPEPGQAPNIAAAFWSGFNATRTPDAEYLFRLRLQSMDQSGKAKALAGLAKIDAELAEKAMESERYSREATNKQGEIIAGMYGDQLRLLGTSRTAQATVDAAKVSRDTAQLNAMRLTDAQQLQLSALQSGLGKVALDAKDPAKIAQARADLASLTNTYVSQAFAQSVPEQAKLSNEYSQAIARLQREVGSEAWAQIGDAATPVAQLDLPEPKEYGVSSSVPGAPEIPAAGGSVGESHAHSGAAGGRAGGSGIPGMPDIGGGFGPSAGLTAIQDARAKIAQQMADLEKSWNDRPWGNVGDPLLTRSPWRKGEPGPASAGAPSTSAPAYFPPPRSVEPPAAGTDDWAKQAEDALKQADIAAGLTPALDVKRDKELALNGADIEGSERRPAERPRAPASAVQAFSDAFAARKAMALGQEARAGGEPAPPEYGPPGTGAGKAPLVLAPNAAPDLQRRVDTASRGPLPADALASWQHRADVPNFDLDLSPGAEDAVRARTSLTPPADATASWRQRPPLSAGLVITPRTPQQAEDPIGPPWFGPEIEPDPEASRVGGGREMLGEDAEPEEDMYAAYLRKRRAAEQAPSP